MNDIYTMKIDLSMFKTRYDVQEDDWAPWLRFKFTNYVVHNKINSMVERAKRDLERAAFVAKGKAVDATSIMRWFRTSYKEANTGHTYSNGLYANNEAHAEELIIQRNLGEERSFGIVDDRDWILPSEAMQKYWEEFRWNPEYLDHGMFVPSKLSDDKKRRMEKLREQAIHGSTFVAYLAMKSGVATVDETLSDGGIVHRAVHICAGTLDNDDPVYIEEEYARIMPMLRDIEQRVPGLTK